MPDERRNRMREAEVMRKREYRERKKIKKKTPPIKNPTHLLENKTKPYSQSRLYYNLSLKFQVPGNPLHHHDLYNHLPVRRLVNQDGPVGQPPNQKPMLWHS